MADGWVLGGRYRVLDRVGAGAMAEVFRTNDELLDRLVAVKVFRSTRVADDAGNAERRQVELQALARLNHPNLITLYDGNLAASPPYLVMELIDGPSLAARIADGPIPEAAARQIGSQIADGLAYVHSQGMVHRDVKPDNILLGVDRSDEDSEFRARLSDFGIVRLLGAERMTSADFTVGTASYLAPEQARGSGVDTAADVYSLALVLLEALTGQRSFEGPPLEAAIARLARRPTIPANLPEPWPRLLFAMTELSPTARPTAAQVARTLRARAGDTTTLLPAVLGEPSALGETSVLGAVPAAAAPPRRAPMPPVAINRPDVEPADAGVEPRRHATLITAAIFTLVIIIAGTIIAIIVSGSNDSGSPARTTAPASHSTSSRKSSARSSAPSSRTSISGSAAPSTDQAPSTQSQPSTSPQISRSSQASTPPTASSSRSTASSTRASTSSKASSPASSSKASTSGSTSTSASASASASASG